MHALLLPILLASLTGLVFGLPYEFGYHPSAEEFDSLLRDTRTWTRDLLANDRRRMWTSGAATQSQLAAEFETETRQQTAPFMAVTNERFFVPKYNGEQTRQHYTGSASNRRPQVWQSHVQKIDRPFDGGLEFQMFSDEHLGEQQQPIVYESVHNNNNNNAEQRPLQSFAVPPPVQVQSALIEVNEPNKHLPATPRPALLNVHQQNINVNDVDEDNATSGGNFPIFFTNPATGIVYAITEVGKTQDNQTSFSTQNPTIPIYITKAQYDNDIEALRQRYESNCHTVRHNSTLSTTLSQKRPLNMPNITTTTARPQIVRLQRPATSATISKLPTGKLPVIKPNIRHQRPKSPLTPVKVQNSATVQKVQVKLPTVLKTTTHRPATPTTTNNNAQDKPKKKRKKKKKRTGNKRKRPGLKPDTPTMPQIVLGTRGQTTTTVRPSSLRAPTSRKSKMATQLERPHVPPPAPPTSVIAAKGNNIDTTATAQINHHVTRRSAPTVADLVWQNNWPERAARKISTGRRRKQKQPKTNSNSKPSRVNVPNNRNHTLLAPSAVHLLHRRHNGSSEVGAPGTVNATMPSMPLASTVTAKAMQLTEHRNQTKQRKKLKRNKAKHRGSDNEPAFNLFDLVDIGATDDDDYDDDDDDDDNDDDDDVVYYYDSKSDKAEANKKALTKKKLAQYAYSDYPTAESLSNLKEEIQEDNSSSPEESADFGAMEEEPPPTVIYGNGHIYDALVSNESNTKTSMGKKRIRRRPSAASDASTGTSDEDYNDDDDEDDGIASSSIGGFFRMIFYPVQMAMSRFFDGLNGSGQQDDNYDDDDANKVKYPTYTLYNNAINQADSNEAGEDDDDESLGGWFSSLFGLRRKTKKIGSTTIAPLMAPPPAPLITEEPSWLETWFGFGKATEQADNESNWFFSWFDAKPKAKAQRRTTTSTTTTTAMPQVPILTIVDPMRNPQNWIGILAHHIVNATTTTSTTHNPLIDALMTRVTTSGTTTENPDVPRRISYEKYQIWRLKPQDEAQVRALEEVKKSEDGIKMQWLKGPSLRGLTDVLVPPKILVDFQGTLNFEGIAHEVLIFDVGKAISYEQSKADYLYTTPKTTKRLTKPTNTTTNKLTAAMTWHKYYDYDGIIKYLETIRMRHTQLVELIHIGRSYEGRPLIVVKIEAKQSAAANAAATVDLTRRKLKYKRKPVQANAVFIEAGAHGLAWIGPAAATWIINELLRIMRTNKTDAETDFIRNTTWYIMPVLNPDGYVYSHEYDRFWKKSRSRHLAKTTSGILNSAMTWLQQKKSGERICHGVDLDRNWQYHWGKRGSSKSPCNEFYAGPVPFSEPETKALSEFLMDYRSQVKLYISLQAYGQVISYPIKANSTFNMERMDDFLDVAMVGTDGLRKKGSKTRYKVDSANDLIEHRSGCSDAFAAYEIGIPFSYTLQLADNGVHGYLLPSSSIEPTARDAFEIITGMLDYI